MNMVISKISKKFMKLKRTLFTEFEPIHIDLTFSQFAKAPAKKKRKPAVKAAVKRKKRH